MRRPISANEKAPSSVTVSLPASISLAFFHNSSPRGALQNTFGTHRNWVSHTTSSYRNRLYAKQLLCNDYRNLFAARKGKSED
jgi:hypothetical protein